MLALDPLNNLATWPLAGFDAFVAKCIERKVGEVNLTGSNTDPLLYRHHAALVAALRTAIPGVSVGIRTNGALALAKPDVWALYDKASVSITSLNPTIYAATMGGTVPDIAAIARMRPALPLKVNIVLCPEQREGNDLFVTLSLLSLAGIKTVNLREPYGQPHIGNPFGSTPTTRNRYGMPCYDWCGIDVTYWDVHYVGVESVNLYANGVTSETYPIVKDHAPGGVVRAQEEWPKSGRQFAQWVNPMA